MTPLLSVRQLAIRINGLTLVDGIDFDVAPAEMLGIVGESGSGKSITLRALLRLLPPTAQVTGQVTWQGQNMLAMGAETIRRLRGRQIGMVFQEPMTALDPMLPVGLQITESLNEHLKMSGRPARRRAVELLDLVGIPDAARRLDNYPHEFSGGMRQRAMIAIALAGEPKLLLADEPTTALDVTIQDQILKLLLRLRDELSMSVILVTHDLGVVAETCDRVAVLYAGRMMETGSVPSVFRDTAHAYTLGLMRSVPDGRHARQRLTSIGGSPPEPAHMPPGCRFQPRCTFGTAICGEGRPPLHEAAAGHATACLHADRVREAAAQSA